MLGVYALQLEKARENPRFFELLDEVQNDKHGHDSLLICWCFSNRVEGVALKGWLWSKSIS